MKYLSICVVLAVAALAAPAAYATCLLSNTECQCKGSPPGNCVRNSAEDGTCHLEACHQGPEEKLSYRCDCTGSDVCDVSVVSGLVANAAGPAPIGVDFACHSQNAIRASFRGPLPKEYTAEESGSSNMFGHECFNNATHCACQENQNPASNGMCTVPTETEGMCVLKACGGGKAYQCACGGSGICTVAPGTFYRAIDQSANPDAEFPCTTVSGIVAKFIPNA